MKKFCTASKGPTLIFMEKLPDLGESWRYFRNS